MIITEYGKQFKPCAVFDNNENIWGTEKHNVKIYSPQEIKLLDMQNTVFVITSSYYEEIFLQLQNFGAKHIILFEEVLRMNA